MIIRVEHKRRYAVIANESLRDARLSFRATGLLAYLLSLPDDSAINASHLADAKSEGRDAIRAALKELEDAGYLVREKRQDRQTGTWMTISTVRELPGNPQPTTGFQASVNQASVNQALKALEVPTQEVPPSEALGGGTSVSVGISGNQESAPLSVAYNRTGGFSDRLDPEMAANGVAAIKALRETLKIRRAQGEIPT